jgi:STE24 endopeptidase
MALLLTILFVFFLSLMIGVRYWLALRQIRYVTAHAEHVPSQFADRVSLEAHRKAAHYTVAKTRLGIVETAVGAAALVCLTLLGGLQWISDALRALIESDLLYQISVVAAAVLILAVIDLPFSWIRQFRIEQRFGFNRMTPRLWVLDLVKSFAVCRHALADAEGGRCVVDLCLVALGGI